MERKSIGSFIVVLRKANGFTQKELADKLNVSDKTISRWECEDGAPDLSVIPVLAEIFGVTCDELLRGERQSNTQLFEQQGIDRTSFKTEKQKQRLLAASMSRFQNHSMISIGLSMFGLIVAMICNFGFNRAYIGFFAGTLFYLVAVIAEAIFINGAFLAVADDEMAGIEVENYKHHVIFLGELVISYAVVFKLISLPLLIFPINNFMGLSAKSWLIWSILFALLGICLCLLICFFLNKVLQKSKIYTLSENESIIYQHNHKLQCKCLLGLLVVFGVSLIGNAIVTGGWNAYNLASGKTFEDITSFQIYIGKSIPYDGPEKPGQLFSNGNNVYFDENGTLIIKEESPNDTLTNKDGVVILNYHKANQSVCRVKYGQKNGKVLIKTFTYKEMAAVNKMISDRNTIFGGLYLMEILIIGGIYFRKRAK